MAERKSSKAGPTTKPPPVKRASAAAQRPAKSVPITSVAAKSAPANPLVLAVERLEATVADLKRQRDATEAELTAARAQIAALEEARIDAINRIDWVLDSLTTVLQAKR